MKAKFLVPEIDRGRWAEEFNKELKIRKLKSKQLKNIGSTSISEQNINSIKKKLAIPKIESFLPICRFFVRPPDIFLQANPKWIECEIDDVSKFSVLGKIDDTYYISPFRKNIEEMPYEPNPAIFSDCHLYGTEYDSFEEVIEGKILYHIPYFNSEKTSEKILALLKEYNLSNKQIQKLLELSPQSVTNRKRKEIKQGWTTKDIYKLSWILNMPFEELLVIDYHDEIRESLFDPIVFLEHYVSDVEEWEVEVIEE